MRGGGRGLATQLPAPKLAQSTPVVDARVVAGVEDRCRCRRTRRRSPPALALQVATALELVRAGTAGGAAVLDADRRAIRSGRDRVAGQAARRIARELARHVARVAAVLLSAGLEAVEDAVAARRVGDAAPEGSRGADGRALGRDAAVVDHARLGDARARSVDAERAGTRAQEGARVRDPRRRHRRVCGAQRIARADHLRRAAVGRASRRRWHRARWRRGQRPPCRRRCRGRRTTRRRSRSKGQVPCQWIRSHAVPQSSARGEAASPTPVTTRREANVVRRISERRRERGADPGPMREARGRRRRRRRPGPQARR